MATDVRLLPTEKGQTFVSLTQAGWIRLNSIDEKGQQDELNRRRLVTSVVSVLLNTGRAKLRFHADVFWARSSIGGEVLGIWLETYQTSKELPEKAVSWNWSCHDSDRRSNASCAAMRGKSRENSSGGSQGAFAAGLFSDG
jgi:hypothetical protein